MTSVWTAVAAVLMSGALAAAEDVGSPSPDGPWQPPPERIALLPPVEFSLEEDTFASEPIADADPKAGTRPPRRGGGPFGAAAPVSIGGFWAAATPVVRQPGDLGMNAQFARVAAPLAPPKEGEPLWIGIGKFGRLELSTDAILPDSGQPVPDQLWLVETGITHIRPLARGGTLGGTFLFGSASDRPFAAGRDLTLMAIGFWNTPAANERDEWNFSLFYSPTSQLPYPLPGVAYAWRPSDAFEAKLGVPASIEWRPDDKWTLSAEASRWKPSHRGSSTGNSSRARTSRRAAPTWWSSAPAQLCRCNCSGDDEIVPPNDRLPRTDPHGRLWDVGSSDEGVHSALS